MNQSNPATPETSRRAANGSDPNTGGWASGSIAVIIPVHGTSDRASAKHTVDDPAVWNLKGLRRASSTPGNRLSQPNIVAWDPVTDARITSTRRQSSYALFQGTAPAADEGARTAGPLPTCLADPSYTDLWTPSAVELFTFPRDTVSHIPAGGASIGDDTAGYAGARVQESRELTYLVVHLIAKPDALRDISRAVGYFAAPYTHTDQQRPRWPSKHLTQLLREVGFPVGTKTKTPFILTHLVPDGAVPDACSQLLGATENGWRSEQIWAWRLAGGPNLTVFPEPGWDERAPIRNGFWSGSTWCRLETHGAAFMALHRPGCSRGLKPPVSSRLLAM